MEEEKIVYCFKCKQKRPMVDITYKVFGNSGFERKMAKGKCQECGTNVSRFLKVDK